MSDKTEKKGDDSLSDILGALENDLFKAYSVPKTGSDHHIYLSESIEGSFRYVDLCHALRTKTAEDVVYIYLSCFGGDMYAGAAIISAIRDSKAQIITVVTAPTFSMGSTIALAGDNMIMKPNSFLMFHNYTATERGKGQELVDAVVHGDKWAKVFVENVAGKFLTKQEHKRIGEDKDVYVHWNDENLIDRYARHWPGIYKDFAKSLKE